MKYSTTDYEQWANDALERADEGHNPEMAIRFAQIYATLAHAAAVAEQTEVLKGLVVNGQLKVWAGVK